MLLLWAQLGTQTFDVKPLKVKKLEDLTIPVQAKLRSLSITSLVANIAEVGGASGEKYLNFTNLF